MPPIETWGRFQKAVLWRNGGYDNYGEVKVLDPVEIDVRWEDTHNETVDPNGNVVAKTAQVVVNQDIAIGSILWKGELADLPSPVTNLHQVIGKTETPDLKNRNIRRQLTLMRYKNSLPDEVAGTGTA